MEFLNDQLEVLSVPFNFSDFHLKVLNRLLQFSLVRQVLSQLLGQLFDAVLLSFDDLLQLLDQELVALIVLYCVLLDAFAAEGLLNSSCVSLASGSASAL